MQQQILKRKLIKALALALPLLLCYSITEAHNINNALKGAPVNEVAGFYFKLGYEHILPFGADHILFIIGLCLLSPGIKTMLWQATAFTVAHTITLALSMKNIIVVPPAIAEPVIALSIVFVAVESFFNQRMGAVRLLLVFAFGLIHGMGFASALNETGLPPDRFISSLLFFNIGVEAGQITVIGLYFLLLAIPFSRRQWYKKLIVYPAAAFIACIGLYWTFERVFG